MKLHDLSIKAEEAFDITQHLFMKKILSKCRIEKNFIELMKDINKKTSLQVHNSEMLVSFLLKSRTRQKHCYLCLKIALWA